MKQIKSGDESETERQVHMTSNRNKFHVPQLLLAFQLFLVLPTLIVPLSARNIKGNSVVSKSNSTEILVIMPPSANVTSIYSSFSEFKKMFGVEFPDDRRVAFKNGEGEFPIDLDTLGEPFEKTRLGEKVSC